MKGAVTELLSRWQNDAALAADAGTPRSTAKSWRERDRVPIQYWARLIAGAEARNLKGVTWPALAEAHGYDFPLKTGADRDKPAVPSERVR